MREEEGERVLEEWGRWMKLRCVGVKVGIGAVNFELRSGD